MTYSVLVVSSLSGFASGGQAVHSTVLEFNEYGEAEDACERIAARNAASKYGMPRVEAIRLYKEKDL